MTKKRTAEAPSKRTTEVSVLDDGLPANLDAERFILGSILLDPSRMDHLESEVRTEDLCLQTHQLIFTRMKELNARHEKIDRVSVTNELMRFGDLEKVGGMTYIISLDDGMPHIANLEGYIKIIRDKSMLRRIAMQAQQGMNAALLGREDPSAILARMESGMTALAIDSSTDLKALNLRQVIERTEGGFNAFIMGQSRKLKMPTGIPALDEMIYGIQTKKSYIIAGDTSHGKSSFSMNIGMNLAMSGYPGLYFTVEMDRSELLQRMICSRARVSMFRLIHGYLDVNEMDRIREASNDLLDLPIYIDDTADLTAEEIVIRTRKFKHKHGIMWTITDYLQILNIAAYPSEYAGLTAYSRAFKMTAKSEDVASIVLSQFSKDKDRTGGTKMRRPNLGDLHGTSSISKDADVVAFIWRPHAISQTREDLKDHAELIVAKHRGGPRGTVNLTWDGATTTFRESPDQTPVTI